MRASSSYPSFCQLATAVLSLSSVASAWPSWILPEVDALVVRADSGSSSSSSSSSNSNSGNTNSHSITSAPNPSSTPASSGSSDQSSDPNTFNLNTGGMSQTASGTSGGSGNSNGNGTKTTGGSRQTMFNPQDPAGAVVMMTPAATAPTALYKIGDFVTWGWNYTNLQGTPTAVDVYASCSVASRTYTLTQNMTFQTSGSFTWDTGAYQSSNVASPLLVEQYTLIIFDADSSVSATAQPGYLGTFEGFTFGLYTPQPYTPLADGWTCASCNGAVSDMEKRALGFILTMCVITVASFTWFVTGLGVAL